MKVERIITTVQHVADDGTVTSERKTERVIVDVALADIVKLAGTNGRLVDAHFIEGEGGYLAETHTFAPEDHIHLEFDL